MIDRTVGCGTGTTAQGTLYNIDPSQRLEVYEPKTLEAVHRAVLAAVEEQGYTIDKDALDAQEGIVEGRTALNRPVKVWCPNAQCRWTGTRTR